MRSERILARIVFWVDYRVLEVLCRFQRVILRQLFSRCSKSKILKTKNKKWVNNFYNETYRPNNNTIFNNLYVVGSHTKTSVNIWSMEGACESGKLGTNLILKKYNKQLIKIYNHDSTLFVKFIQTIDDILYKIYLPNILDILIILIIILLLTGLYITCK